MKELIAELEKWSRHVWPACDDTDFDEFDAILAKYKASDTHKTARENLPQSQGFKEGDEVAVILENGEEGYTGVVDRASNGECLVVFGDDSQIWFEDEKLRKIGSKTATDQVDKTEDGGLREEIVELVKNKCIVGQWKLMRILSRHPANPPKQVDCCPKCGELLKGGK